MSSMQETLIQKFVSFLVKEGGFSRRTLDPLVKNFMAKEYENHLNELEKK